MFIVYLLAMIVLLGLCVFVHEFGHLLGGKLVGIKARTFSIGFGKGIFKKEWNGTTYQIAPIPLGGFCSFYGESASETREGKSYEFLTAAPWRRIITVVMGPVFNLIFGIILFFAMNMIGYTSETNQIVIPVEYTSGDFISPAHLAGMQTGDRIVRINGKKIVSYGDIQNAVIFSGGRALSISAERGNETKDFSVSPRKFGDKGYYLIGILPYGKRVLVSGLDEKEPAFKAGLAEMDEIKSVNEVMVDGQKQFIDYIRTRAGQKIDMTVVRRGKEIRVPVVPREKEILSVSMTDGVTKEKIELSTDNISVVKDGIKKGTVKINGAKISSFEDLAASLGRNKGKEILLENAGGSYKGTVSYEKRGYIGVVTAVAPELKEVKFGFGEALSKAFVDPYNFIVLNLKGLGMLVSGKLNVRENVSGPIKIAKIAGDTAYYRGLSEFVVLMAKISIILMVMNLLPLPAVDGSFIIFFTVEWIRRRALNDKIMERIQIVGFIFIILLSVGVIFNDLTSLPIFQKVMNLFR